MEVIELKLTKANLNRIIVWSSSRYNDFKKQEVVDRIFARMAQGRIEPEFFSAGSYCPGSNMGRTGDYHVDYVSRTIVANETTTYHFRP